MMSYDFLQEEAYHERVHSSQRKSKEIVKEFRVISAFSWIIRLPGIHWKEQVLTLLTSTFE